MSEIELYGYGESVASNMARVALSEKNISYKYNLLYLESKGEHLSKDYKKLNPKNLVPTMVDKGNIIPDSIEIMQHINKVYSQGTDLFPVNINRNSEILRSRNTGLSRHGGSPRLKSCSESLIEERAGASWPDHDSPPKTSA